MDDGDGSAAALEAVGLNPRHLVDRALDIIDDVRREAFEFARKETATAGVLGAAKAAQKAEELDRGFNAILHMVLGVMDKRMTSWERYCFRKVFTLPEGFALPEDDNSCAKKSQKDRTSHTDLDLELDSLRKKLGNANKESENLRREMASLERETTYKRELESSIAEMQKLFEEKSVQKSIEDVAKAIPILQQKLISLNKKRTEAGNKKRNLFNLPRDNKRLALDKDCTPRTEDIQEVASILQKN